MLPELQHSNQAAIEAEQLLDAVAATHTIGQYELEVTASIGISVYPNDGVDAEELIKNADAAMYQAKDKSGSSVLLRARPLFSEERIGD